jgi:hypothetical protein
MTGQDVSIMGTAANQTYDAYAMDKPSSAKASYISSPPPSNNRTIYPKGY